MNSLKAKVYTLYSPYELILKEEEVDGNVGDYELIAETTYSAISPGTEVSAYVGLPPLRPGNIYPRVVGYCNVSRVLIKGTQITNVEKGDYILTFQSHRTIFKLTKDDFYLKIESKESIKYLATAYLYHLGYHSLITADVKQGHNVGVIGAGVLGYTTAIMSEVAGANTFVFSNQDVAKEKFSNNHIFVFTKHDDVVAEVNKLTYNTGLDIIVNTSNSWNDWLFALKAIRKGGVIVNLGFPGRGEPAPDFNPLDPQYIYTKNITIKALGPINECNVPPYENRFNMSRNLRYILDLIETGIIDAKELISDEVEYAALEKQYTKYINRDKYILSSLLKW